MSAEMPKKYDELQKSTYIRHCEQFTVNQYQRNMALIPASPLFSKYILLMNDREIKLTVTVGNGQMNSISYSVKPTVKDPASQEGMLEPGVPKVLGKDNDLHKQRLSLLITVGASTGTETSALIKLTGGEVDQEWAVAHPANEIGDVVAYEVYIRMTKS